MPTLLPIECFVCHLFVKWNEFQTARFYDDWIFSQAFYFPSFIWCIFAVRTEHICYDCFKSNAFQLIRLRKYAKLIQVLPVYFLCIHCIWLRKSQVLGTNTRFQFFNGFDCYWLHEKKIEREISLKITALEALIMEQRILPMDEY